ncbi:MAG TPA: hypothetical protein VHI51_19445 [Ktedonobacterales bacterium]|jgi:hypothetical protein|nr:hypothetical protein [Ktedonobacterales bacterium]
MSQFEDLLIDALLDDGFTLDEALRLIALQERWYKDHCALMVERPNDQWRVDHCDDQWN